MRFPYIGSGPYCYANSLAMLLGRGAPPPSAIEVLTGSPFGFHLGGGLAWFDPLGWDTGIGLDAAIELLGFTCERGSGGTAGDAAARLRAADGPALVGPVEMGLLGHQPGSGTAIGADHFVVVTGVTGDAVHFHDPHGHPFATLPVDEFTAAWESVSFEYPAQPFTMRTRMRRVRSVDLPDALQGSLPAARRWLTPEGESPARAVERFAALVAEGPTQDVHGHLVHFAVRVGARRLADAAAWLAELGHHGAAAVAGHQARHVGGLQHPLVQGDRESVIGLLRRLSPTYAELDAALATAGVPRG